MLRVLGGLLGLAQQKDVQIAAQRRNQALHILRTTSPNALGAAASNLRAAAPLMATCEKLV